MRGADAALADLTPAERRAALAAAISSVTVFGVGVGFALPLLSLLLEARGVEASLNGLNAASAFIGVTLGPLLTPLLVRRLGIRALLGWCFALDVVLFLLMKVFDGIAAWFALRIALGVVGSSIFTASEAWINLLAGDAGRGRIIGLYASALAGGFGLGPLLLSVTGIAGWTPFVAGSVVTAVAVLPLLLVANEAATAVRAAGDDGRSLIAVAARARFIVLTVVLFGLYEAALLALLPIWASRRGFDTGTAAATLTAVYLASIALQLPIGWLSDKVSRLSVLRLCGFAGLLGALAVPFVAHSAPALFFVLVLWGGLAAGIYPVALSMAGERFRGAELVTANAALIAGYGAGGLLGPALGGAAMDLWNPDGLLMSLALLFALFLVVTLFSSRAASSPTRQ
jgi:MFS family permease